MESNRLPKTGEMWAWDCGSDGIMGFYVVVRHDESRYWYINLGSNQTVSSFDFIEEDELKICDTPKLISILYGLQ